MGACCLVSEHAEPGAPGSRMTLPIHTATRYVTPLREGGSLPAVLDTEEGGLFVTKFRGAGQGAPALVAEIIVTLLARRVGLPAPEIALVELDETFGRTERDPEIQDILKGSIGLNVGYRYLDGAFGYDPLASADFVTPDFAADVVWLDAYTTNIDRTPRNPNILIWQREPWLIDQGAALYFHHNWPAVNEARIRSPFPPIKDHVLLPLAGDLWEADRRMAGRLSPEVIEETIGAVPDALLMDRLEGRILPFPTAESHREAYMAYLNGRLQAPRSFVEQAVHAQAALLQEQPSMKAYRR
ncbi:MAG TPA: HipA family kinase [Rhodothermales bacterium]|nr:HipA family kinase [Rhodothermales bacterium]